MSDMLQDILADAASHQEEGHNFATILTNVTSAELRTVVQFIMFGRIPPGREEDSYIPSKGNSVQIFSVDCGLLHYIVNYAKC